MVKYILKSDIYNFKLTKPIKIGEITITPDKNIDSIYSNIKKTGNHLKTCSASSNLYFEKKCTLSDVQSSPEYNETINNLDIICKLISFSQKCHIHYYGIYLYKKRRLIARNYPHIFFGKSIASSRFICNENTLVHFINSSFNVIKSKNNKEKYLLLTSLWFYILSFNEKYHTGAQLIELWIIFEMLINFYSVKFKNNTILETNLFGPIHDKIKEVIDGYIGECENDKSNEIYRNGLIQIKEGIGNLNQQKIINKAVFVLNNFNICVKDADIRSVNKIRNLIFHGNILNKSQQDRSYTVERQLNFLLERLYLKIFKYNNNYSDSDWKDFHANLFVFDKI